MATIYQIPSAPAPVAAVSRILARYDRPMVEAFISIAIDLLDTLDGDPDVEDRDPDLEPNGDERDLPWPEWHPGNRAPTATGLIGALEDDEDDDPAEDDGVDRCAAGDDIIDSGNLGCSTLRYEGADQQVGCDDGRADGAIYRVA